MVTLKSQDVVASLIDDLLRDLALGAHRIDRDEAAAEF